jgi:cell fate (sporulation/competence/biofilm development) regulator YlbF (YheA/YmcA/DUF963 family)
MASKYSHHDRGNKALQKMYNMLEDSGYSADRAEQAHQQAQEAAIEALEVACNTHTQNMHMRELLAELQRSCRRSHS